MINRNDKNRFFLRSFFCVAAGLLAAAALLVALFDPMYHYHAPLPHLKAVLTEKEYQVIGSLRHFDYDAVIAGSSMAENSNNHLFDEVFGVTSVKAIRASSGTADLCWFLKEAFAAREKNGGDVRYVFYNMDPFALDMPTETTFASSGCPMYLYDHNPVNDVKYLFNADVLFEKIPYLIAASTLMDYDEGLSYNWAKGKVFDKEAALSHYERKEEKAKMLPGDSRKEEAEANAALLCGLIEAHPDTTFVFFLPPYSMLYWDDRIRTGERDVCLYNEQLVLRKILSYDNAEVYFYHDDREIAENLDLYMDTVHFKPEINDLLTKRMAEGSGRLYQEDIDAVYDGFRELTDEWEERLDGELPAK